MSLLCYDEKHSGLVASYVTPEHFEEPYKDIAARCLEYHERYGKPPGATHIDDLFDHVLMDREHPKYHTYKRLLDTLYAQKENLNTEYIAGRAAEFVRKQTYKAAITRAAERYTQGGETIVEDVERILQDAFKVQVQTMDLGVRLGDKARSLQALVREQNDALHLGIEALDIRGVCPTRKELLLFLGPRGRGKSWFLIHCGRVALFQRWNTVHISLEMTEERLIQRYFQNLFSVAKRDEEYSTTLLEFDKLRRVSGLKIQKDRPMLNFKDPEIIREISRRMDQHGAKFDSLIIKQFPTGSLRVSQLENYLDLLERVHGFIPDLLLVDYPDLMWKDVKNPRISIGRTIEELRGLGVKRNMAVVAPSQSTRRGEDAALITASHTAEDISKIATADNVITFNQTKQERSLGMARLYVPKARNDEDNFAVLITQAYKIGQFMLESHWFRLGRYWEWVEKTAGKLDKDPSEYDEEESDDDEDEGDEK